MKVNNVSLSNNYGAKNQRVLSNTNELHQSRMSFSAKEFPSGDYSEWFVDFVKYTLELPPKKSKGILKEHMEQFRTDLSKMYGYKEDSNQIEVAAIIRDHDFLNLQKDLKSSIKGEELGEQSYDEPEGVFSSTRDQDIRPIFIKPDEASK